MGPTTISIKVHKKEWDLFSKNLRTKQIKKIQMRALKSAGWKVMKAEHKEVRRVFNKRPATGAFVAKAIQYEPFEHFTEVHVGPFRKLRPKVEGKTGRTGKNAAKILADHIHGASYTGSTVSPRGFNATRLRNKSRIALPAPAFEKTRNKKGELRFKSARYDLQKHMVLGNAKKGIQKGNQAMIIPLNTRSGRNDWIAVRSNKQLDGWGLPARSTGKRKGKRAVSVKHRYIIPLFVLKRQAKVKKSIRFYQVARKVAPRAVAESFRKEFNKGLPISKSLGITPTIL